MPIVVLGVSSGAASSRSALLYIALDAALRMDGISALDCEAWSLKCYVRQCEETRYTHMTMHRANCCVKRVRNSPKVEVDKNVSSGKSPPNAKRSRHSGLFLFEDDDAVIKMRSSKAGVRR